MGIGKMGIGNCEDEKMGIWELGRNAGRGS